MTSKIEIITYDLYAKLKDNIEKANSCYILTSFMMDYGVRLLEPLLRKAASNGTEIRIVTGDYLYITQPSALERLLKIHPSIELRLWISKGISFHPKAYIFENGEEGLFIVGSSNMSRSALTTGVEWNVMVEGSSNEDVHSDVVSQFFKVFYNDSTVSLNEETAKIYKENYNKFHKENSSLIRTWSRNEEIQLTLPHEKPEEEHLKTTDENTIIKPRFAQIDALAELENSRLEGYDKAMVVMATGLGKTYLAAFFAENFKRVLYIAHLEEILHQAEASFNKVNKNRTTGIYNGKEKNSDADIVFASIQTLSRKQHLDVFSPTDFDLIIVDEFHHAAANSYRRALDYFKAEFLLGITATPDRNDYRDIYALCDGNVAYRIDFIEAIQKQWLSPFHYYGVYDNTDYTQIKWLGKHYDAEELAIAQLNDNVAEKIFDAWKKYKQTKTIVFCSSIVHADFLADYFKKHGAEAVSLHSKSQSNRNETIEALSNGEIDCIMVVDLFNEGVDIPSVDTLVFARPTESLTVFTQQIGRGLRLYDGKTHCVIIDLIANYRNADIKQSLFYLNKNKKNKNGELEKLPDGCVVDFDLKSRQLIEELSKKHMPRKELLKRSYFQVKKELGRRPTYLEVHMHGFEDGALFKQEFKSYFGFLKWTDELSKRELEVFLHYENWLYEVERTLMTKSYKMILLKAMLERGINKWMLPITAKQVAPFFHSYLMEKEYRKLIDFNDNTTKKLWEYDEEKIAKLIEKMPMTKWSGRSKNLLSFENHEFKPTFDISTEDKSILYEFTNQICEYRLRRYFERKSKK